MRSFVAVSSILALLGAFPAQADEPAPFRDFTFKRIKPPKTGSSGNRIKVQIDPAEQAATLAKPKPTDKQPTPAAKEQATAPRSETYAWFWEQVRPEIDASGPGRLQPALNRLSNPPAGQAVAAPRLKDLHAIAKSQNVALLTSTVGTRVSPALALAVISVESGGRVDAESGAGAQGLMQLIPATAERFGVSDSLNASQNIKGGVAYLDWLLNEFDGDPILALAAYNAGENAVKKHQGVPPYSETRDYVPKVLAAYSVARGLCKTPPQLISDGCVFNLAGGG